MKQSEKNYKRIVIKIGSSLFCDGRGLDSLRLSELVSQASQLVTLEQKEVIIVSSGAIALGMNLMKLSSRPKELDYLQAVAAVGQNALMDHYSSWFKKFKLSCGQVLLTRDDFNDRERYLNAKATLLKLLKLGVVPVINENDTVSTEEIKFGDNDRLSALVASLVAADLLIILSDVDGLLDKEKKLVKVVDEINAKVRELACPTTKKTCVGGMVTKLDAAKIAVDSGLACVIANGKEKNVIMDNVHNPGSSGTLFVPKDALAARQRWIAFGTKPKGAITVDEGAKKALLNKKSLLAVGVASVAGVFSAGDIVSVKDRQQREFARGKVTLTVKQLDELKGKRIEREVIHRDNIVIL